MNFLTVADLSSSSGSHRFDLTREAQDDGGYDSTNEDDAYTHSSKRARFDLAKKDKKDAGRHAKASKEVFRAETAMEEGRKQRLNLLSLSAYDRHKQLVNTYQLYHVGATSSLTRDKTRDKRDIDVVREHHKFLWDDDEGEDSWEVQLARRYYDKLFKEYCIIDLSRYKENKFGMRWRTEKEVTLGKGQFVCGNKKCDETRKLRKKGRRERKRRDDIQIAVLVHPRAPVQKTPTLRLKKTKRNGKLRLRQSRNKRKTPLIFGPNPRRGRRRSPGRRSSIPSSRTCFCDLIYIIK